MEQNLSWKKAYLVSALLHVVIAVIFAVGLAEIVAEKEQQMYVVDLATSNLSQGSGHEGGGGGAAAFPEPLKAEDVAKRVETVQQEQTITKTIETQQQPTTPETPVLPAGTNAAPTDSTAKPAAGPVAPADASANAGTGTGQAKARGKVPAQAQALAPALDPAQDREMGRAMAKARGKGKDRATAMSRAREPRLSMKRASAWRLMRTRSTRTWRSSGTWRDRQ